MEQKEDIVEKFHNDLGKLVFEATTKLPIQRVVSELDWIKVLIEVQYINTLITQVKATDDKNLFDRMYG